MAAKNTTGGGEHRIPFAAGHEDGGRAAKPEKQLNSFVRTVVLIEKLGNALGTLAFTWATVILLGGYPTVLRQNDDFWFATIIVFLEAARIFSRNNRDYQLFFHTKGVIRPLGWNGLIIIVYFSNSMSYLNMLVTSLSLKLPMAFHMLKKMIVLVVPTVLGIFRSSRAHELLSKPLREAISLYSPLFAVLLLLPLIVKYIQRYSMAKWMVFFTLLLLVVLLLTITRIRFRRTNSKSAANHVRFSQHAVFRRRSVLLVLNLCMFVELVMLVLLRGDRNFPSAMFEYEVLFLGLLLFGNLQILVAIVRVVLSLLRLEPQDYDRGGNDGDAAAKVNLVSSLNIFYGMVLCQGMLYCAACVLGIFSFIPRRALARRGGFNGRKGMEFVDSYYAYAWDCCVENDVLARKKISLCSFALDSIMNSDCSPRSQLLLGVQLMVKLLQAEPSRTRLLSRLSASVETTARIVRMLDRRTSAEDTAIRLFAVKAVAELAKSLRLATLPSGTIQLVSALLDTDWKQKRESCALVDIYDDEQEGSYQDIAKDATTTDIQKEHRLIIWDDSNKLHETPQACSSPQAGNGYFVLRCRRCWKWISRLWPSPHNPREEPPMMDHDDLLLYWACPFSTTLLTVITTTV